MVISTNTLKTNKCFYLQAHLKKVYPLIPFMTWCCSAPGQFVLLIICTCCAGLFGCDEHVEGDVLLRLRGLQGYVNQAAEACIPKNKEVKKARCKPWWNRSCEKTVQNAFNLYQSEPNLINFLGYEELDAVSKNIINKAKRMSWRKYCTSLSSRRRYIIAKLAAYKENALHGRFPHDVDQEAVDKQASYNWLTHGELQPETEGFLIVIQDQVIKTNNYRKHILKDGANNTCRRCGKAGETIPVHHTLGGCQLPYQYGPRVILESENYEIYWDRTIITDRRLEHSRPDIVVKIRGTKK
nr:unnamed protein product [Callosobruchus chinensis]